MKKQLLPAVIVLSTVLITSCTSTLQGTGVETVKITSTVPKNCQFLGNVGISEKDIYGPSHKTKQNEQLNILRSQALRLGANVVVITSHKTKYYHHPEYILPEGKMQWELDAHAMSGKAYRCKSQVANQINQERYPISDVRPIDE